MYKRTSFVDIIRLRTAHASSIAEIFGIFFYFEGEIESAISEGTIRFEKQYMGGACSCSPPRSARDRFGEMLVYGRGIVLEKRSKSIPHRPLVRRTV